MNQSKCLHEVRLDDLFPDIFSKGAIFAHAANGNGELATFLTDLGVKDLSIDIDYVTNHSGRKLISSLILSLLRNNGAEESQDFSITISDYTVIENILTKRFLQKWKKLKDTLELDFDPISPYNMTIEERGTDDTYTDKTVGQTNTKETSETSQETRDHTDNSQRDGTTNLTESETFEDKKDGNSETDTFGYNSVEEVPQSVESYTDNDNSTRNNNRESTSNDKIERTENFQNNGTVTGSETEQKNSTENAHISNPTTRNITRKGNIGNTSMQELVAQQREMLQWQFWNVVFDDVDTVLTRGMF